MAEKDYYCEPMNVGFSGEFDMHAFYNCVYKWFKKNGYTVNEKEYKEYKDSGKRKLYVYWKCDRKVDDYMKHFIEVKFKLSGIEGVKGKKTVVCDMDVEISPWLYKDYEEVWTRKNWMKFLREIYDKLVIGSRMKGFESSCRKEADNLITEMKSYLNLTRLKKQASGGMNK